jgi:hypothetical protein
MMIAAAQTDTRMSHLTTLEELKQHISVLAGVEETDAPFISCYFSLENGPSGWRDVLEERARTLRRILKGNDLADLEQALTSIEDWMTANLLPQAKGVAIFVRGDFGGSFMLPMQFAAPLPNWIAVYPTPNIYHLVELKDNYHRYLLLHAMADRACILEVNLGAATIRAWINEPELRTRVGKEWSRSHYQVNQSHRGDRFVHGKIAILQQLMRSGAHTHLILAGDPEITRHVRQALPNHLARKLVELVPADQADQQADVVMATLARFVEHEEQESRTLAQRLIEGLCSQDLAVAGTTATLDALRWGDVDTLVMLNDYQPDPGWICTACKTIRTEAPEASTCPCCGKEAVRPLDIKEALMRLAAQSRCPVEVVQECDALKALGGVGCLLRSHLSRKETSHAVAAVG